MPGKEQRGCQRNERFNGSGKALKESDAPCGFVQNGGARTMRRVPER
jgi:hypothetical protein